MSKNLGFKITVEYYCENMIDEDTFRDDYFNDVKKCYDCISDLQSGSQDHPLNFTDDYKVIKVELLEK